jgi:hypothetical protein
MTDPRRRRRPCSPPWPPWGAVAAGPAPQAGRPRPTSRRTGDAPGGRGPLRMAEVTRATSSTIWARGRPAGDHGGEAIRRPRRRIDIDRPHRPVAGQCPQEGSNLVEFRQRDALTVDVSPASVVTLYLLSGANLKLRPTLQKQLNRLADRSHQFGMGDWVPRDRDDHRPARRHVCSISGSSARHDGVRPRPKLHADTSDHHAAPLPGAAHERSPLPWVILVPARPAVSEIIDLGRPIAPADRGDRPRLRP